MTVSPTAITLQARLRYNTWRVAAAVGLFAAVLLVVLHYLLLEVVSGPHVLEKLEGGLYHELPHHYVTLSCEQVRPISGAWREHYPFNIVLEHMFQRCTTAVGGVPLIDGLVRDTTAWTVL